MTVTCRHAGLPCMADLVELPHETQSAPCGLLRTGAKPSGGCSARCMFITKDTSFDDFVSPVSIRYVMLWSCLARWFRATSMFSIARAYL